MPFYVPSFIFWNHFPSCPSKSIFSSLIVSSFSLPCSIIFSFTLYFSSSFSLLSQPYEVLSWYQVGTARKIARIFTEGSIASTIKAAPASFPHLLLPNVSDSQDSSSMRLRDRRDSPEFLVQSPRLSISEASPNP